MSRDRSDIDVSVALCTFNGGQFLRQQLESIASQDHLPREIVVQDDQSTDDTLSILREFARSTRIEVRVERNERRLGFSQNFGRVIGRCRGQIIALCDQDDVWPRKKIARAIAEFSDPSVGLTFSNAEVVDQDLKPLRYDMWGSRRFTEKELRMIRKGGETDVLLKHYTVTGATMAFRGKFKDLILPIPVGWNHDAWIALLLSCVSRIRPLPERLLLYRQHARNAVGARRRGLYQQVRKGLLVDRAEYYKQELGRFKEVGERLMLYAREFPPRQNALCDLEAKVLHLERRALLPKARLRRIVPVLREIARGGYARYARNWQSIALDLIIP